MQGYNFFAPTRVLFGVGSLNELGKQQILQGKKAMLVVSNGNSVKKNGYLRRVEEQIADAGATWVVFDEIEANPKKTTVERGAQIARSTSCNIVVALGGGSVMDSAKNIAALATNEGDMWDYMCAGTGKGKQLSNTPLPVIAITTTAGTGSEVDQYGVATNEETQEKMGFGGYDSMFPVLAIVDPELMVSVPPVFTAYQGFDALFHSTEVYISKAANPMSDMVAERAIRAIAKYLPKAVADGSDLEARSQVAFANTMSGYAMVAGSCTSEHSIECAMSAYHPELAHGAGLIMISEAYYQFMVDNHACDERMVDMAKFMGYENAQKPQDFITALVELQKKCGVYGLKMSDYGISPNEFEKMAVNARQTMGGLYIADPHTVSDNDCVSILKKSFR